MVAMVMTYNRLICAVISTSVIMSYDYDSSWHKPEQFSTEGFDENLNAILRLT